MWQTHLPYLHLETLRAQNSLSGNRKSSNKKLQPARGRYQISKAERFHSLIMHLIWVSWAFIQTEMKDFPTVLNTSSNEIPRLSYTWSSSSPLGIIVFLKAIVANVPPLESNATSLVP